MYTKNSPEQQEFLDRVGDDEPIFILRARDALATSTIGQWLELAYRMNVPLAKREKAQLHLEAFYNWRENNQTKLPD